MTGALPVIGVVVAQALAATMVTFTTVARGSSSQIMESREEVVRSAAEWQTFWKDHSSQPPPIVDFSQSIVVGVFLGSRPTAGYQVEITTVKADSGLAVVEYIEHRPKPGALVAQVLTSPFHLVSIPASSADLDFRQVNPR